MATIVADACNTIQLIDFHTSYFVNHYSAIALNISNQDYPYNKMKINAIAFISS